MLAAALAASAAAAATQAPRPHVLLLLVDDWGRFNVGFRGNPEAVTPNIDALAAEGVQLDYFYAFKYCSPSRSALQSGRNPIYVNVLNSPIEQHNPADPVGGYMGIPVNLTALPAKLGQAAGYATHQVGKWNAGMATPMHTPEGRGYMSSLCYFSFDNDYWTQRDDSCNGGPLTDLFDGLGPASTLNSSWACSQANQTLPAPERCAYEDDIFTQRVLDTIAAHDPSSPLLLSWNTHAVHAPYEVPSAYLDRFPNVTFPERRFYDAMVAHLDDDVGKVVAALRAKGMWDNLLVIVASDNGGPGPYLGSGERAGANNFPLRGFKMTNWEGGIRVNAFLSGGFLNASLRGTTNAGLLALEDVYTTLCSLAGVDPYDPVAAAAGLHQPSGVDFSGLITGANTTSPRAELPIGSTANGDDGAGTTVVQGLLRSDGWKLLIGNLSNGFWTGPVYPNATNPPNITQDCGDPLDPSSHGGCLFNVFTDPGEHDDVAAQNPAIVQALRQRIAAYEAEVYSPDRGAVDPKACATAMDKYGGFWGPWVGV